MKYLILLITTFTFLNFKAQAQIGVGSKEMVKMKPGKFKKEDLKLLKSSKTIFLYDKDDDVEKLKKAIKPVWKITPISFVSYKDFNNLNLENTSVFSSKGFTTNVYNSGALSRSHSHGYLNLWLNVKNKKGKIKRKSFCRVELHDSNENWEPGFIRAYLANVNDLLEKESERWLYLSESKPELNELKNNTLYIPDYVLTKFNAFTGDTSKKHNVEDIMKSYPYDYKIIKTTELSDKILVSDRNPIYFLVYVKSSTDKYVSIYNSKTGKLVYSDYKGIQYNLNKSDFKKLAKAIKRS